MPETAGTETRRSKPTVTSTADREIVIERTYDAPRELVWAAWTDAKHLDRWWGPNGFRNETSEMDFRVGGTWRYLMRGPDGTDWPNWIRYRQIVKHERLEYDHGGGDGETQFEVVVTFTSVGQKTRVVMRSLFPSAEVCQMVKTQFGAVEGGHQTLARLSGLLPHLADGSLEGTMVLSRVFDAPAKLAFQAWSTPEGLKRWWGPKDWTLSLCEIDFRVGGAYRMTMRSPDGIEAPFHGKYLEIVPNQKIVFDAQIAPGAGNNVLTTVTFVEENGQTLLTVKQTVPELKEAAKGMREGWNMSLVKLAAALKAG